MVSWHGSYTSRGCRSLHHLSMINPSLTHSDRKSVKSTKSSISLRTVSHYGWSDIPLSCHHVTFGRRGLVAIVVVVVPHYVALVGKVPNDEPLHVDP